MDHTWLHPHSLGAASRMPMLMLRDSVQSASERHPPSSFAMHFARTPAAAQLWAYCVDDFLLLLWREATGKLYEGHS